MRATPITQDDAGYRGADRALAQSVHDQSWNDEVRFHALCRNLHAPWYILESDEDVALGEWDLALRLYDTHKRFVDGKLQFKFIHAGCLQIAVPTKPTMQCAANERRKL